MCSTVGHGVRVGGTVGHGVRVGGCVAQLAME